MYGTVRTDWAGAKVMRSRLRRLAVAGLVLALACVVGIYGWGWWTTARDRESTDNAYVRGDVTAVGPKVAGYVADVPVDDNQIVEAGTDRKSTRLNSSHQCPSRMPSSA